MQNFIIFSHNLKQMKRLMIFIIQYRSSYVKHGLCKNLQEIALCVFLLLHYQLPLKILHQKLLQRVKCQLRAIPQ